MGYQPGNTSVVSDFRFNTDDAWMYNRILKNVIFHEVGHNLNLSHCENDKCIMSFKNGLYQNLYFGNTDYCDKCKDKLLR